MRHHPTIAMRRTAPLLALLILAAPTLSAAALPSFPGAEGFGAESIGGRGGRVIEVTNLNDAGPGSLREAIEATGPRTVVFRIGGSYGMDQRTGLRVGLVMMGAWWGLFVGMLIGLFSTGSAWIASVLVGVTVGAVFGLLTGMAGYRATGGQRDFTSTTGLVAETMDCASNTMT